MYAQALLKNLSWQGFYEIISSILGFMFYIVLANKLGQTGVGIYSYLLSIGGFIILILDSGTSPFYLRKWAASKTSTELDIQNIVGLKTFLGTMIGIIVAIFCIFFERALAIEFALLYLSYILYSLLQLTMSFTNSQNDFKYSFIINSLERLGTVGLGTVALFLHYDLKFVFLISLITRLILLLVSQTKLKTIVIPNVSISNSLAILQKSTPLLFLSFFANIYFRIDAVIIKFVLGVETVGIYSSAYRIFEALLIFPSLIRMAASPIIIRMVNSNENKKLEQLLQNIVYLQSTVSAFIILFFAIYAKQIVHFLYGSTFISAAPILSILSIAVLFMFNNLIASTYLYGMNQEKFLIKAHIFLSVLNMLFNLITLPIFGITGAAIVTVGCEVVMSILLFSKLNISLPWKPFFLILLASVISYTLLMVAHLQLFPGLILSGIAYCLLIVLLRVVDLLYITNQLLHLKLFANK